MLLSVGNGTRVKSVYVGRVEIAQMVSQIHSSSPLLEKIACTLKSPEAVRIEKSETALEQVIHLIQLLTQATLFGGGFSYSSSAMETEA